MLRDLFLLDKADLPLTRLPPIPTHPSKIPRLTQNSFAFDKFNLRDGSFAEGWNWLTNDIRKRQVTRPSKCHTCGLKVVCGMCPANGELENGDPEAPVDFLCHTAHLRASAFSIDLPAHGDCEYCNGGEHEESIRESAARLLAGAPAAPLGALTAASSCGTGCSSCQVS